MTAEQPVGHENQLDHSNAYRNETSQQQRSPHVVEHGDRSMAVPKNTAPPTNTQKPTRASPTA